MTNHGLDTDEQILFYEQEFYVLSNFSSFTLHWRGLRFDTSEAAYHWEKFIHYPEVQKEILQAPSAHRAFEIAALHKAKRREDWDQVKIEIMYEILLEKAAQHHYVAKKLQETGKRILIENSWRDSYWGWGPNHDGQNILGRLWMKVRDSRNFGLKQPLTNL